MRFFLLNLVVRVVFTVLLTAQIIRFSFFFYLRISWAETFPFCIEKNEGRTQVTSNVSIVM